MKKSAFGQATTPNDRAGTWTQESLTPKLLFLTTPGSQRGLQKTTSCLFLEFICTRAIPKFMSLQSPKESGGATPSKDGVLRPRSSRPSGSSSGDRVARCMWPRYPIWKWCPRPECAPARPWCWGSCAGRLAWPSFSQTCSSSVGNTNAFSPPFLFLSKTTCTPWEKRSEQLHPLLP